MPQAVRRNIRGIPGVNMSTQGTALANFVGNRSGARFSPGGASAGGSSSNVGGNQNLQTVEENLRAEDALRNEQRIADIERAKADRAARQEAFREKQQEQRQASQVRQEVVSPTMLNASRNSTSRDSFFGQSSVNPTSSPGGLVLEQGFKRNLFDNFRIVNPFQSTGIVSPIQVDGAIPATIRNVGGFITGGFSRGERFSDIFDPLQETGLVIAPFNPLGFSRPTQTLGQIQLDADIKAADAGVLPREFIGLGGRPEVLAQRFSERESARIGAEESANIQNLVDKGLDPGIAQSMFNQRVNQRFQDESIPAFNQFRDDLDPFQRPVRRERLVRNFGGLGSFSEIGTIVGGTAVATVVAPQVTGGVLIGLATSRATRATLDPDLSPGQRAAEFGFAALDLTVAGGAIRQGRNVASRAIRTAQLDDLDDVVGRSVRVVLPSEKQVVNIEKSILSGDAKSLKASQVQEFVISPTKNADTFRVDGNVRTFIRADKEFNLAEFDEFKSFTGTVRPKEGRALANDPLGFFQASRGTAVLDFGGDKIFKTTVSGSTQSKGLSEFGGIKGSSAGVDFGYDTSKILSFSGTGLIDDIRQVALNRQRGVPGRFLDSTKDFLGIQNKRVFVQERLSTQGVFFDFGFRKTDSALDLDRGFTSLGRGTRRPRSSSTEPVLDLLQGTKTNFGFTSLNIKSSKVFQVTKPAGDFSTLTGLNTKQLSSQFSRTGLYERTDLISPRVKPILQTQTKNRNQFSLPEERLSFVNLGGNIARVGGREIQGSLISSGLFGSTRERSLQPSALALNLGLGLGLKSQNQLSFKSSTPSLRSELGIPRESFNFRGFGLPVALPGLDFFDAPRTRGRGKRKFRRTPSLVSVELGLTSSRQSPLEFTGLVSRPILTRSRKRRRK